MKIWRQFRRGLFQISYFPKSCTRKNMVPSHHPVTSLNKTGKLRRVASAASVFKKQYVNKNILSGTGVLNNMDGLLLYAYQDPVEIMVDIRPHLCRSTHKQNISLAPVFFGQKGIPYISTITRHSSL